MIGFLLALFSVTRITAQTASYAFTTLAGTPTQGYADGAAGAARFSMPEAVAVDASGNVYVADYNNELIRKIAKDGTVSTLAGSPGVFGFADGSGSAAKFGYIFGIAVDANGNVFVPDGYSSSIRRITQAGLVQTYGGTPGRTGSLDGPRLTAQFNNPTGIAIDSAGNMYITDRGNYTIRKIAANGTVTTLAGKVGVAGSADGNGTNATFRSPYGIAVDANGNVYVADNVDNTIRKITANGDVTTLAGAAGIFGSTDGVGGTARFNFPAAIAVDTAGNLAVADRGNYTIRGITASTGAVMTLIGSAGIRGTADSSFFSARFFRPTGIAYDRTTNTMIVADTYNCTIRKIDSSGNVTTLAGEPGRAATDGVRAAARFYCPLGVAIGPDGSAYVADTFVHVIRKISPDGTVTTVAGASGVQGNLDGTGASARFRYPENLAVDAGGNLYVTDSVNATIRKITPSGIVGTLAGLARTTGNADGNGASARFNAPWGIVLDASGNLIVADELNHTLRKITPAGDVTTIAGSAGISGNADGPATLARFNRPRGLAFDSRGNLYIADYGNDTIRRMTPAGLISTIAGVSGTSGFADGTGGNAKFDSPTSVAVDPDDNIFVADSENNSIRKITSTGVVSTIGGYLLDAADDGYSYSAGFWSPSGIASDSSGNLYIADTYNGTIRKAGRVGVTNPTSRLFNLSVRANLLAGQTLITGFVVDGGTKNILVRAIGPGLAPFLGESAVAGDPRLDIYNRNLDLVAANDNWGGSTLLSNAFTSVSAFSLPATSLDAAALPAITGSHTAHVVAKTSGIGLVEAYDTGAGTTARLINVSARYPVSSGSGVLIAGFVLEGAGQKTLLIRGVGPTLAAFGLSGVLSDPRLEIYNSSSQKIAENDDWSPSLSTAFNLVNAFGYVAGSKDAALLITLPPGSYSAQLSGVGGTSGEGLIEVYEVGN